MGAADMLSECLRDSPKFRAQLTEEESQIELLEEKLERVYKTCGAMVDSGKTFVQNQTLFANSLWDMSSCFQSDVDAVSKLNRIIQTLQEMSKYQTILLDQASRTILKSVSNFIKEDIKGVWDSRQHFDKVSNELDAALTRNSQVGKYKLNEVESAQGLLQATNMCFRHIVLDHVFTVSMLQAKKKQIVLGTLSSYLQAHSTYFHQGFDLCEGLQAFLRNLDEEILQLQGNSEKLEKNLGNRHSMVNSVVVDESEPMQGYLFKRTTNAFKTWHRRWFLLKDNQLVYRKRTGENNYTVMEEDLRLCSVKPAVDCDRRFCFEVLSPSRSHMLQADSEEMFLKWISSLQQGIGAALQLNSDTERRDSQSSITPTEQDQSNNNKKTKIWDQLLRIPGNDKCCDCKSPDPRWASINLGITLCIDCSGVHRSLGVHHSKVRSLTLDAWEPEILKVMAELGNKVVNTVYEAKLNEDVTVAAPNSTSAVRENYIKRKWVNRDFVPPLSVSPLRPKRKWSVRKLRRRTKSMDSPRKAKDDDITKPHGPDLAVVGEELEPIDPPHFERLTSDDDSTDGEEVTVEEDDIDSLCPTSLLYKASAAHNIPVMCQALALGANKLWLNPDQHRMSHLHQAVASGSVMACEYLILNGVPINSPDETGKTPLHYATELGHTAQVCLLLKHRADQHIKDSRGLDALDIAVDMANADIVTLLRLGRLNEEMKDSDPGTGGDDTFNDVVRDFSQLTFTGKSDI